MQITQNVEPPYDLTSHKRPPPVSDNLDLTCVVDYGSFDFIYYLVSSTAWLNPYRFILTSFISSQPVFILEFIVTIRGASGVKTK